MHKHLIIRAFKKAKREQIKIGNNQPSDVSMAKSISDFVDKQTGLRLDERTYRNYYSKAEALVKTNQKGDINIHQLKIVNGLCSYLNYKNYEDFVTSLPHKKRVEKKIDEKITGNLNSVNIWIEKNKIVITLSAVILTFFILKASVNKQRWMVWEKDQYIEVKFDLDKFNQDQLKEYNEVLIANFKKVNAPNCNTQFFNAKGEPILWYWKKNSEELEIYTAVGLHPTNGITLKPITKYMIQKYICPK